MVTLVSIKGFPQKREDVKYCLILVVTRHGMYYSCHLARNDLGR